METKDQGCPYISRNKMSLMLWIDCGCKTNYVNAVVPTQAYIKAHHTDAEFGIKRVCRAVGYSRRQLDRLFQKHMRITLYEYISAVLLSESAAKLLETDHEVIDVALDWSLLVP